MHPIMDHLSITYIWFYLFIFYILSYLSTYPPVNSSMNLISLRYFNWLLFIFLSLLSTILSTHHFKLLFPPTSSFRSCLVFLSFFQSFFLSLIALLHSLSFSLCLSSSIFISSFCHPFSLLPSSIPSLLPSFYSSSILFALSPIFKDFSFHHYFFLK